MYVAFAVGSPDMVHETTDGETAIGDLAHGTYHQFERAAAAQSPPG